MKAKDKHPEDQCDKERAAVYKSVAARLNYRAPDRGDIQFAVKEICRRMSAPTWRDWSRLKRVARYLASAPSPAAPAARRPYCQRRLGPELPDPNEKRSSVLC